MTDETPEEKLARFREMAEPFTENLDLAGELAMSSDPAQREIGRQMIPIWSRQVEQWAQTIARLEQDIADGEVD